MSDVHFALTTEFVELFKLLKITGLCESGGAAKYVISQSQVQVDGKIELRKAFKVRKGMSVKMANHTIVVN